MLDSKEEGSESEAWANALLGRIFWDFLGEKYWADMVSKKIQMKLSKIRVCMDLYPPTVLRTMTSGIIITFS